MSASNVDDVNWWTYVEQHAAGDDQRTIARKLAVDQSTVSRWKAGQVSSLRPPAVAAFARAYNRPVLEAFIAAGFLTPEEASERPSAPPSLTSLTDDDLLKEVAKRMREGGSSANTGEPRKKSARADGPTRDDYTLATRRHEDAFKNLPDTVGEESQDDGSMDPA